MPPAQSASALPRATAQALALGHATQALLRCAAREAGSAGSLTPTRFLLPVLGGRAQIAAGVEYWSATGHHRFALPVRLIEAGDGAARPIDLPLLASLLIDALAGDPPSADQVTAHMALIERIADSTANIAAFLASRPDQLDAPAPASASSFIATEQSLLLGHQLHPTPKSRGEFSPADLRRYSPETQGRFQLAWLAVDPSLVQHGSAVP
ncbi:MAG: IucA/IucC family protein, partial [Patulibacter sp.]